MKKVVSLFLTLVLAMSLAVPAFAASEATFSLNAKTATVEAGDSLSLELKVDKAMKDVESFEFWIYYNAEVFELTSGEAGKCCGAAKVAHSSKSFSDAKGAYYKVTAAGFTNGLFNIKAGTIYTLTFKAKDTVTAGTATFTLSNEGVYGKLNTTRDVTTGSPVSVTTAAKTVNVTSITLSSTTMNLEVGQTGTLTATVTPDNATNKTVTWTTSNDKVATVANGVVTAVGKGTATITAAADGKTATCTVTVKVPAHKHTPVAVPAQESTCMEKGWEAYYKCSECGTIVDENGNAAQIKYLPLAAHKLTETKAVPATCTEDGTEAYWTCSVCKKMFADKDGKKEIKAPVKVAALGHDIVKNEDPAVVGVRGSKMWLYSATCKNCQKTVYVANLVMPENTINVIAKQSDNSKKDFSKAVTFGVKASDSKETLKFTIDPVTDDIVKAAKTEAGYKVTETIYKNGAYGWGLADYSETPEAAYAALAEYLKNGITFTQTISAKENTWAADAKSHTMTFDINTADGTFTVKVDGKNESTITFTNTFTYKTVSPGGGGNGGSTTTDTTKNDGKKVESGKTFDAGIAMYVGLSVLSVTGGALVIGKKKERF